eukprot:m.196039 g.196039  ORF g.196039 m.196039 type:complete len:84 (-) comp15694_c0_seq19:136-387(-)
MTDPDCPIMARFCLLKGLSSILLFANSGVQTYINPKKPTMPVPRSAPERMRRENRNVDIAKTTCVTKSVKYYGTTTWRQINNL